MRSVIITLCILLSASFYPLYSQGGRITSDPIALSGSGRPIGGVNVSVCQPLSTTAASVTSNLATYTMSSNPQTAGFAAGMQILVAKFTGADTYFNAGTLANNTITGGQIILSVTPTTIITMLVHANASATSNGTILQIGNSVTSCASLSSLFTDATLGTSTTNPIKSDGLGNYGAGIAAGVYYTQIYGPGVTTTIRQIVVSSPSSSGSINTCTTLDALSYYSGSNTLSCDPHITTDTMGQLLFLGSGSGQAGIGVPSAAGTPCEVLLPTTSPTAGQFLSSAGPSAGQCQMSWSTPAGAGTIGGSISAGQTAYGSSANAIAGGTKVLDMKGISGGDLGAIMNNCATQLAGAGICKGDNLTGALTWSSSVTTAAAVVYTFCGQTITQTAAFNAANANSGIIWCPNGGGTITKGANIDQITLSASSAFVVGVPLIGAKASFTGNGIVVASGCFHCYVGFNNVSAESNDDIKDESTTHGGSTIESNNLSTWGLHAFQGGAQGIFTGNFVQGDATGTGSTILVDGGYAVVNNPYIADSGNQILVNVTGGGAIRIENNILSQSGGSTALALGGAIAHGNYISGGGTNGQTVTITSGTLEGNIALCSVCTASLVRVTGSGAVVSNNQLSMSMAGTSNLAAVELYGDLLGTTVSNNSIGSTSNTNGDNNYGVHLVTTIGSSHMYQNTIEGNQFVATNGGGATATGFFLDNAGGILTEFSSNVFAFNRCTHETACVVRSDTTNQTNFFIENQGNAGASISTAGSTSDVIIQMSSENISAASLPNAGNGSIIHSNNCGGGFSCNVGGINATGLAYRIGGVWSSTPTIAAPQVICAGLYALDTNLIANNARDVKSYNTCSIFGTAANIVHTTDHVTCDFSGDPNGVTGYAVSAPFITLRTYVPTGDGAFDIDQINQTGGNVTPGAQNVVCSVTRP